jgi:hypothetical protein
MALAASVSVVPSCRASGFAVITSRTFCGISISFVYTLGVGQNGMLAIIIQYRAGGGETEL